MKQDNIMQEIGQIRSLMERSSKFLSISGLSGVLIGCYALLGAFAGYYVVYGFNSGFGYRDYYIADRFVVQKLIGIAVGVLVTSLLTGLWMAQLKASKVKQPIWNPASKALLFAVGIPLVTGGVLSCILIFRGDYGMVASSLLIFYGLSLCAGSTFTFKEIRWLGIMEIVLGLGALCVPGYGLWFWAIGFGLLHIIYGLIVHNRYE